MEDATVYMIGEIQRAMVNCSDAVYCRWEVIFDQDSWKVKHGRKFGQTLISEPNVSSSIYFNLSFGTIKEY